MLRQKVIAEWNGLKTKIIKWTKIFPNQTPEQVQWKIIDLESDIIGLKNSYEEIRNELDTGWDNFVNNSDPLVRCNGCKSLSVEFYDPQDNKWVWGHQERSVSMFKGRIRDIYIYYRNHR